MTEAKPPRPKNALKHGFRGKRDGIADPLYTCWLNLRARCENRNKKDYENYGGRGIYYSPKWIKFENFMADMAPRPEGASIERIDNDGPYYKENCRWATPAEQSRNRRNTFKVEFNGKSQTLPEWARELGINRTTLQARLKRNVPVEIAFTTPV